MQESGRVKLKLEQPAIMCSGRSRVTCYYKARYWGDIDTGNIYCGFITYDVPVTVEFVNFKCITPEFEDLVIVKVINTK